MIEPENNTTHWWQRRSGWAVAEFDVFCGCAIIAILTIPALADVAVPIPLTRYIINLGDLPPWIMAFVVAITWYEARAARKHAAAAGVTSSIAVAAIKEIAPKIEKIEIETNSMRAAAEAAKLKEGRNQVHEEIAAANTLARTEAVADAETKAKIATLEAPPVPLPPST